MCNTIKSDWQACKSKWFVWIAFAATSMKQFLADQNLNSKLCMTNQTSCPTGYNNKKGHKKPQNNNNKTKQGAKHLNNGQNKRKKQNIFTDIGWMKQMTALRAATCANKASGKDKFSLVCFFNSRNCASVAPAVYASWNWKVSSTIQFYIPFNTALSAQLSLSVKYFLLKNHFFCFSKVWSLINDETSFHQCWEHTNYVQRFDLFAVPALPPVIPLLWYAQLICWLKASTQTHTLPTMPQHAPRVSTAVWENVTTSLFNFTGNY